MQHRTPHHRQARRAGRAVRSVLAVLVVLAGALLATPAGAGAATAGPAASCGIAWGSLPKGIIGGFGYPLVNVRGGEQPCFDRLVIDYQGPGASHASVRYVPAVHRQGSGDVLPLRGGAFLQIDVWASTYGPDGTPTYRPPNPNELVAVGGWQTFRQVAFGGTSEGYTTIGLGVRARLPFRIFTLTGPGSASRLVIDVANHW